MQTQDPVQNVQQQAKVIAPTQHLQANVSVRFKIYKLIIDLYHYCININTPQIDRLIQQILTLKR